MSARRGLAVVAALALALLAARPPDGSGPRRSLAARLLGPIASVAASVQWVRFDAALDAGRPALAYARAASALELDPRGTGGWLYLARHLVFQRGSVEVEPDPARRARWIRAGLELLEEGEAAAREPAALALERGLVLSAVGDAGAAISWPGGPPAAYREAAAAYERAARLGAQHGEALAASALTAAARAEEVDD